VKVQRLAFLRIFPGRRRERLVRNYFFVAVILIAGGLISAGILEIYFRYVEGLEQVGSTQQDAATAAALRIERFIQDVATTMKAATKSANLSSPKISKEYEFELKRLLFLAPAITEAVALDIDGAVRAQVSRFRAASLVRAIFRNQLLSKMRGKGIPISARSISEIQIHTSLWLCPLSA
jgi:hypothetical protein